MTNDPDVNARAAEPVVRPLAIQLTAYYAEQAPSVSSDEPPALLVALHGFGQKCKGFMRNFVPLRARNIFIAAPQGPHQFYMQLEPKKVGFNWITIYEKDDRIRDFLGYMDSLLKKLQMEHSFDGRRVFILGFSQGVSMGYRFAVSGTHPVAGMIACCADLPSDVAERLPDVTPFPVLLAHAEDDPIVPLKKAEEAEATLRAHNFHVDRLRYTGGHAIPPDAIKAIGDWIDAR